MSMTAADALRTEIEHASELISSLSTAEWTAPSGCTGWTVQDVVCHMASVFHSIADPSTITGGDGKDAEADAEVPVRARRSWTSEQVAAEYRDWSTKGLAALVGLQEPPMADVVIPIANLGSHPMHILCNAIVFDHYCHLRHDIGHAVPRAKALPHDPIALDATLEWMLAGLPQMCAGQLAGCTTGVNIAFEGDVERGYRLVPADDGWRVLDGTDATLATVVTSAHDFVAWGTKRSDWRDVTAVRGDATAVAATLDAINVI